MSNATYFPLNDVNYKAVKWTVTVVMPSLATLYFTLGQLWGFPAIEEVLGTAAAIETFLGVVLGISSHQYYGNDDNFDGVVDITETEESLQYSVNPKRDPYDWPNKDVLNLRVRDAR